jgi:hypothetical protein
MPKLVDAAEPNLAVDEWSRCWRRTCAVTSHCVDAQMKRYAAPNAAPTAVELR